MFSHEIWGAFHQVFCQCFLALTNFISYWNPCIWLAESKFVSEKYWQNAWWNAPQNWDQVQFTNCLVTHYTVLIQFVFEHWWKLNMQICIWSAENQKGIPFNTVERCSVENQKGINSIQRCSVESQKALTKFCWEPEGR